MKGKSIINFCTRHIWSILLALLVAGGFLFFLDQRITSHKRATKSDFITAKMLFDKVYSKESLSKENLDSASDLLERHPELAAQYQGILSLALAQSGNAASSQKHSQSHLNRVETLCSPLHKEFIEARYLILNKQYEMALEKSLVLDEELQKESSYPYLRDFNLLRIAFLAREMHKEEICKKTFERLQESPLSETIQTLFSEEGYTLEEYF